MVLTAPAQMVECARCWQAVARREIPTHGGFLPRRPGQSTDGDEARWHEAQWLFSHGRAGRGCLGISAENMPPVVKPDPAGTEHAAVSTSKPPIESWKRCRVRARQLRGRIHANLDQLARSQGCGPLGRARVIRGELGPARCAVRRTEVSRG